MTEETVSFSEYQHSDLLDVLAIEKKRKNAWSNDQIQEQLGHGSNNFVLRLNGLCVAYCMFQCVLDQADLLLVVVDQSYRRCGYAEKLLTSALKVMRNQNISIFYLDVRESNLAAIKLYQKIGFQLNGRRKNYYSGLSVQKNSSSNSSPMKLANKEDALLMSYILS